MSDHCRVTVWRPRINEPESQVWHHCGEPLAAGSRFCAHHEAERVRLGGFA